MSKHIFLSLLLLAAALASAREHPQNWIEVRSPRFSIVTNSGEKQGRRIAAHFERMRALFQQAYPQLANDLESSVVVLAVKNKDQFRTLEPRTYRSKNSLPLHGMYVRASDKNYILMRLDFEAGNPNPVVYHEYTHLFLQQADERVPLWLNEGLAEFYQNTEIYDQRVLLGEPTEQRLRLLRQEKLLPLATLFAVDEKSPYYLEAKKGSIFYAECWALTHYLTLRDYWEKTTQVLQYTKLVNDNVDPVTAAIQVFGDLQKLQRSLELYIDQPRFNYFEIGVSSPIDESQFDVQSMTSVQAKAVQAGFLIASGRPEEARALLPSVRDDGSVPESTAFAPSPDQTQVESKLRNEIRRDIPCPLSEILHGASERAGEMVDNLQRFTAIEEVDHTEFKKNGTAHHTTNELFDYVAEIAKSQSGSFWIEEYRSAKVQSDAPLLSDTGTAGFALIFHPQKIGNFEFHCEAWTDSQGTPAWQLRFEESPDPRKSFHQIRINRSVYQLQFQGRAWIAADSYQILRLETDLMAPIPQIHLQGEHLDITYAPVEFDRSKFLVWLPASASMQIRYRGHRYQRLHKFSHFRLFLVVTEQTVKEPTLGPG
jgi:Protein of unknown function (DUF1570)